jgi:hypothetical protein
MSQGQAEQTLTGLGIDGGTVRAKVMQELSGFIKPSN